MGQAMPDLHLANRFLSDSDTCDGGQPASPQLNPADANLSLDQLTYMADLIEEMRNMAQAARLETLSGILGLAVVEANQQIAIRRRT